MRRLEVRPPNPFVGKPVRHGRREQGIRGVLMYLPQWPYSRHTDNLRRSVYFWMDRTYL